MAWTTSGNLREFFGARDRSLQRDPRASHTTAGPARLSVTRLLRHAAVLGLVIAHLVLLGGLVLPPDVTAGTPVSGLSMPWLTITGMMLAILLLAQDWPAAPAAAAPGRDEQNATVVGQRAEFAHPARTISLQHKADPMTGLLARVSHDLRTPLNSVMGFSDLMQREAFGPLGDARYQSYARHIHASSAELLKATEDTLAMTSLVANPLAGATETADLSELISDAFTMALIGTPKHPAEHAAASPPVMLTLEIAPQLQVRCERRALRQAMINLVSAAIGKMSVTGSSARTIHAKAVTNEDIVCLTISVALSRSSIVSSSPASGWNSAEDLPICLARALLDLQGLSLTLSAGPSFWSAQVLLDGVSQSDFFAV